MNDWKNKIFQHDALKPFPIPDSVIDVVITSPPYWGLRDYGVDNQIGLENHPFEYIQHLLDVACEVKRVLKKSGSFYLNLGDTYFGGGGGNYGVSLSSRQGNSHPTNFLNRIKENKKWLQPKQLMLIPGRVAIALQEDGWILRNDIIWHKPNPMPSSVKDRLNNTFEHVFHFVKNKKYYYDLDNIREPHKEIDRRGSKRISYNGKGNPSTRLFSENADFLGQHPSGKNPGDVMDWSKEQKYLEKYDSKYAKKKDNVHSQSQSLGAYRNWLREQGLPEYNIKGKNPGDIINAKYKGQDINPSEGHIRRGKELHDAYPPGYTGHPLGKNPGDFWDINTQPFISYRDDLEHFAIFPEELIVKPLKSSCPENGIVLDPFCGRGTVGKVAKDLGLNYVLFDIKPEYVELAYLYIYGQKQKLIKHQRKLKNVTHSYK